MYIADPTDELIPGLLDADVATSPNDPPTYGVALACHADRLPQDLIDGLSVIGYQESVFPERLPPYARQGIPIQELYFDKPGSTTFGGWTAAEHKENIKALKELFLRFGLVVKPRTRTLSEML